MSESLSKRYGVAAHRVQTAINFLMGTPGYKATEPKHMRVGVELSKAEHGGLAKLLVDKGVITLDEYDRAMVDAVEAEADRLTTELSNAYGRPVSTL